MEDQTNWKTCKTVFHQMMEQDVDSDLPGHSALCNGTNVWCWRDSLFIFIIVIIYVSYHVKVTGLTNGLNFTEASCHRCILCPTHVSVTHLWVQLLLWWTDLSSLKHSTLCHCALLPPGFLQSYMALWAGVQTQPKSPGSRPLGPALSGEDNVIWRSLSVSCPCQDLFQLASRFPWKGPSCPSQCWT